MAASSLLVSMWCHLSLPWLQRLQTWSLVSVAGMVSAVESNAIGFDAYHALAIEGAPGALAFSACNGEITAADNAGRLESVASAFDFLGVARVKLKLAKAAVSLAELYGNNGRASVKDKALDDFGFGLRLKNGCHGEKKREALASLKEQ